MTKNEIKDAYFEWMYHLVFDDKYFRQLSYRKLLKRLDEIPFEYTIALDENRVRDGEDLRYRFGDIYNLPGSLIASFLDDRPCSVLEMMIALVVRCEESIMDNSSFGDRTGQWFWGMIVSLGLGKMTDSKFDERYVNKTIRRFMDRKYNMNGSGGLFTVENSRYDMRDIEIWYQMCLYLDTTL